nr:hypothetical protein [Nonomuraea sp. FMUSA5-5]
MAARVRSTSSRASGRPASILASRSRSSTSVLIRADSASIRSSECPTSAGSSPEWRRASSVWARTVARGVRSSWPASAVKVRIRCSLACCRAGASPTCPSMRLKAALSPPISVRGSSTGRRTVASTPSIGSPPISTSPSAPGVAMTR